MGRLRSLRSLRLGYLRARTRARIAHAYARDFYNMALRFNKSTTTKYRGKFPPKTPSKHATA